MSLLSLLPIFIIFVGSLFLFKLDFFFIFKPKATLKFAFTGENTKKSIVSLMLALAGTLGVGNIVGVAVGLKVGGAGSVFWLIASSLFSSAIKYCEVYLSAYHKNSYGMIGVIEKSFGTLGKALGRIYAILALILAIFMGCLFQAQAIKSSAEVTDNISSQTIMPILLIFTAVICVLGKDRIKGAVAIIIPIAALIYTGMCLFVIFNEIVKLPNIISSVIREAFRPESFNGGIFAFIVSSGMKEGFARGLLSNEAGAGTASLSHTSHYDSTRAPRASDIEKSHDIEEAKRAGVFGILEVFFDTLFLCPLTAFAVLLGTDLESFDGTLTEISKIFESYFGNFGPLLLFLSVGAFALSTVFCWYYYGKVSLEYIWGKQTAVVYSIFFFLIFAIGLLYNIPHIIFVTDTTLFFLSLISTSTVIKNRKIIKRI